MTAPDPSASAPARGREEYAASELDVLFSDISTATLLEANGDALGRAAGRKAYRDAPQHLALESAFTAYRKAFVEFLRPNAELAALPVSPAPAKGDAPQTMPEEVRLTMARIIAETMHYLPDRIQGFSHEGKHWIRDVYLPFGKQVIWRGNSSEEMAVQCRIARAIFAVDAVVIFLATLPREVREGASGDVSAYARAIEDAARCAEAMPRMQNISPKHVRGTSPADVAAAIRSLAPNAGGERDAESVGEADDGLATIPEIDAWIAGLATPPRPAPVAWQVLRDNKPLSMIFTENEGVPKKLEPRHSLRPLYTAPPASPPAASKARIRELTFTYTNWRGETSQRRVNPISVKFGHSAWHKEPQWLMFAEDLDKFERREFAMRDMRDVSPQLSLALAGGRADG